MDNQQEEPDNQKLNTQEQTIQKEESKDQQEQVQESVEKNQQEEKVANQSQQQENVNILDLSISERKNKCYQMLKDWDSQRANILKINHGYISTIQQQIDKKIINSNKYMSLILNFFGIKAKQEEQYSNSNFNQIPNVANLKNDMLGRGYEDIHETLLLFEQDNAQRMQKSGKLAHYLQEVVINEILGTHIQLYTANIDQLKNRLGSLNKSIKVSYELAHKKSIKFQNHFFHQIDAKEKTKVQQIFSGNFSADKCLFKKLVSLLRALEQQKEIQRELAKTCIQMWQLLLNLEIERYGVISNALDSAQTGYLKCYGNESKKTAEIKILLEQIKLENIEKQFVPELVLKSDTFNVEYIKSEQKINQVLIEDVQQYIENFVIDNFDFSNLILKTFKIKRQTDVNEGNEGIQTILYISVDGSVSSFDINNDYNEQTIVFKRKPNIFYKLNDAKVKLIGNQKLEVQNKKNPLLNLIKTGEKNIYLFNSQEEINQFLQIAESIIVDKKNIQKQIQNNENQQASSPSTSLNLINSILEPINEQENTLSAYLRIDYPYNINQKFKTFFTYNKEQFSGEGVKKTHSYTTNLTKEELDKKREEFWETRIEGRQECWQILRQALSSNSEKEIFQMMQNIGLKLVNRSLQISLDNQNIAYMIPIFCINDPLNNETVPLFEKNLNKEFEKQNIQIIMRSTKIKERDINVEVDTSILIKDLKTLFSEKIGQTFARQRLFINGRELFDHHQLGFYNVQNNSIVDIFAF